jgi:hypothetical protein
MPSFKHLLPGLLCIMSCLGAQSLRAATASPVSLPANARVIHSSDLKEFPKVKLGPDDEKDPFGVDYNGPFDKMPRLQAAGAEANRVTLKMIVDALAIQAIFPETSEVLINSNLLKQGDQIIIKWLNETSTVILKKVEENALHFTWATDNKEVVYHAPLVPEYFAPLDADPMKSLQQPSQVTINLSPMDTTKPNNPPPNRRR